MRQLSARSYRELLEVLSPLDLHVPARGDKADKRQTQHTEHWSICRFLATYGNTRFVRYPMVVEKRERPDFRLNSQGLEVDIEVTEAVSEDMARIDAMRNLMDEDVALDVSLFRPGMPRRTTQELREILDQSRMVGADPDSESHDDFDPVSSRLMGPGWAGDGVERDWADVMSGVVAAKTGSARKPGYAHFDQMWLLIYDNWSFPTLNISRAKDYLLPKLAPLWPTVVFKHIFIEHSDKFVHVSPLAYEARDLNDLWAAR